MHIDYAPALVGFEYKRGGLAFLGRRVRRIQRRAVAQTRRARGGATSRSRRGISALSSMASSPRREIGRSCLREGHDDYARPDEDHTARRLAAAKAMNDASTDELRISDDPRGAVRAARPIPTSRNFIGSPLHEACCFFAFSDGGKFFRCRPSATGGTPRPSPAARCCDFLGVVVLFVRVATESIPVEFGDPRGRRRPVSGGRGTRGRRRDPCRWRVRKRRCLDSFIESISSSICANAAVGGLYADGWLAAADGPAEELCPL